MRSRRSSASTACSRRQFRNYFARAAKKTGITGENLLRQLELRLDNVVYSLGFAASRAQARQLVRHGHIEVNGRKINIPSYQVRKGDAIQVREKSRKNDQIRQAVETASGRGDPRVARNSIPISSSER